MTCRVPGHPEPAGRAPSDRRPSDREPGDRDPGDREPSDREPADEGYAMMMVLLTMLTLEMLLMLVLGVITSEIVPTVHQQKRARTIAAAEAGENAATSQLRVAYSVVPGLGTVGDPAKLPCTTASTPLTGSVPGGDGLTYTAQITYFSQDPSGQSTSWRSSNALTCVAGSGPSQVPLYALITSRAVETTSPARVSTLGNRSVEAVYAFSRTDQTIIGGPIQVSNLGLHLCWQAESLTPAKGSGVRLARCDANSDLQKFSYRKDYTLVLTRTQSADQSSAMCLEATSHYTQLMFDECGPMTWDVTHPTNTEQRWAYNDGGQFQGINAAGSSLYASSCLTTWNANVAGMPVGVQPCSSAPSWVPDATVGAGAAGEATAQLINYAEYGRCLDVTGQQVGARFLIDYPCKQDPTHTITWNQRWVWDGAGTLQFQTTYAGRLYCLTTAASRGRVLVSPCDNNLAGQRWTMTGATGTRSTSYNVVDSAGLCMSLGAPDASLPAWSTIVVEPCDGSLKQKWNAPPLPSHGGTESQRETTTTG